MVTGKLTLHSLTCSVGSARLFIKGYEKEFPLNEGFNVRKTLYNLYHELNHFNLFGGGYASSAQSSIDQLVSIIAMNPDLEKIILSPEQISSRIQEIAEEINQHYQGYCPGDYSYYPTRWSHRLYCRSYQTYLGPVTIGLYKSIQLWKLQPTPKLLPVFLAH